MAHTRVSVPGTFIWRRIHSLMGLWLVLFLIEHLVTNSQAALLFGEHAQGFVRMVNLLHNFPHLEMIEIFLLGVPLLVHMGLGVRYLLTARFNSFWRGGGAPNLSRYAKNHGYTWMRFTAVIVGVGVVLHVIQFRFLNYPASAGQGEKEFFFSKVTMDDGLYTLSQRLGVTLYDQGRIEEFEAGLEKRERGTEAVAYDEEKAAHYGRAQALLEAKEFLRALKKKTISKAQVIAVTDNFGTATLLTVRNVFKSPWQVALYSIFVLATCFHAGHGMWTFLITWGVILKKAAQNRFYWLALGLAVVLAVLGLSAIWGTYWVNLRY